MLQLLQFSSRGFVSQEHCHSHAADAGHILFGLEMGGGGGSFDGHSLGSTVLQLAGECVK